jgi:hypothetical protein
MLDSLKLGRRPQPIEHYGKNPGPGCRVHPPADEGRRESPGTVTVAGNHGVPADATAIVLDITSSGSGAAGHLVTWAENNQPSTQQAAAFWTKGQQVTTQATVLVNGGVAMKNASAAPASLTASVVGYYTAATGSLIKRHRITSS